MVKLLSHCPVCDSGLQVSELSCPRCQTRIASTFEMCRFCTAGAEHLAFVEAFLRCEGNISRVEKELGISYPTVRNRLTAALAALGLAGEKETSHSGEGNTMDFGFEMQPGTPHAPPAPPDSPVSPLPPPHSEDNAAKRRDVLEKLGRGEIRAEDAANTLRDLN